MKPEILRQLRKQNRLSQTELGKKIGVSRSSICAFEAGTREPSNDALLKISELFDCSIDYLMTGRIGPIARARPFEPGDDESETFDEFGNTAGPIKREDPEEKAKEDAELAALLEDMRTRPGMRMLFKLAHDATEEDVRQAVKIIEALRKE